MDSLFHQLEREFKLKKISKIIMTIAACVTLCGSAAVSVSNPISAHSHTYCNATDEWCCVDLSTSSMNSMTSKRKKLDNSSVYFKLLSSECKMIYISVYGAWNKDGDYVNRTYDNYGNKCDYVTILPYSESAREFQIYNKVNERFNRYCELRGKTNYKKNSAIISFNWSPDTCADCGKPSTVAHG